MVIVSNGFSKFHLAVAAEELYHRSHLSMFLTGAYPTRTIRKVLRFGSLQKAKKLLRLEARGQDIDDHLVVPLWLPESLHATGLFLRKKGSVPTHIVDILNNKSLLLYGRQATKHVLKASAKGARIYHYRAGFGHESVQAAKASGMVTICDHSIAHPALLEYLVANNGSFPPKGNECPLKSFWDMILRDIEQADCVLVNSDFVKETFLHQDWNTHNVKVIYWGVDDQFIKALDSYSLRQPKNNAPLRLLFAGAFEKRKGATILTEAIEQLKAEAWRLAVVSGASMKLRAGYQSFFEDHRVEYKGLLSRAELARCMREADVFVFPSLVEGSARVVFEALAAGCYVITTPNSGSILQDGVHGCLVPPGDSEALAKTIQETISMDREAIAEVGLRNAKLIRDQYRQINYGDKLLALYQELIEEQHERG